MLADICNERPQDYVGCKAERDRNCEPHKALGLRRVVASMRLDDALKVDLLAQCLAAGTLERGQRGCKSPVSEFPLKDERS